MWTVRSRRGARVPVRCGRGRRRVGRDGSPRVGVRRRRRRIERAGVRARDELLARGSRGRERVRVRARSERPGGDEREETDGIRGVGDARVGSGDGDAAVGGARGADASGTRRVRARDGGVGGRECGGVAFTRASFGGGDGADVLTLERRRRGPERRRRRLVDVRRVVGRRHRRHRTFGRKRETLARARRRVTRGRNHRDPTSDAARLDRRVAPRRSREDSRGEDVRRRR